MAVKFRINFGTFHGTQGNYRLDISNTAYSGGLEETISDSEVVSISYTKDYDDFSPIISSTANVTLIETAGVSYDRFQRDPSKTWKVELLFEDPNNAGNYLVYWAGWIVSESYEEQVQTFPNYISFNATDGLGDLSRLDIPAVTSEDEVSLISTLYDSINRTGLSLPIYYNSSLEATGSAGEDYLDVTTIHPYAFYKDDLVDRCTHYARITSILTGVNCRIFQSYGRWYITSWSDYAGVISGDSQEESVTFKVRNHLNVAQADVTENVRYEIKRSNGSNVDLINTSDLTNEYREPFFSVAQQIDNYTLRSINANPLFELGSTGYQWPTAGVPQDLQSGVVLNGNNAVRTIFAGNSDSTSSENIWFWTTPVAPPAFSSSYNIKFSYRSDKVTSTAAIGEMRYRILINYDNNTGGTIFGNTDYHVWNFESNQWHGEDVDTRGDNGYDNRFIGRASTTTFGEWVDVEHTVRGSFGLGDNPRFYIEFLTPVGLNVSENVIGTTSTDSNVSGIITSYIDNVRVTPNVSFVEPHFERSRPGTTFTKEYVATTALTTRGEDIFYNMLSRPSVYRVSQGSSFAASLEEIVTQQRLNDYRNGGSYYRGGFVNNATTPLAMHHKPLVTYSGRQEVVGGILDELSFGARSNISNVLFRIPNQDGNVTSTFTEFDVQPQIIEFLDTGVRTLTLDLETIGTNDLNVPITFTNSDSEVVNVIRPAVDDDNNIIQFSGVPGSTERYKLIIEQDPEYTTDQFEIRASNWYRSGSLEDPTVTDESSANYIALPDYVEVGQITQVGRVIEANINVTIPFRNDTVELDFRGEVDPFIADNREYDIDFSITPGTANATVSANTPILRGTVGSVAFVDAIVSPTAGRELDATTFVVQGALPVGVQLLGFVQLGLSVLARFGVTIQATNQTATITLDGDGAVAVAGGVDTSQVTLNINENIVNTSISRTQLIVSGVVGTRYSYDLLAFAADGFELDSDNFSVTESLSWIEMGDAFGGGESVGIPLSIIFPVSNETGAITVNGSAQTIGADTVDVTINFTNNIANTSLVESTETLSLNPGQSQQYVNTLSANDGYEIPADDVTITETDASNVISFTKGDSGRGAVSLTTTVTAPSADATATVALAGTATLEPYRFRIAINTAGLENAVVSQPSFVSMPFGANDVGNTDTIEFQVTGIGNHAFSSADLITTSAGSGISLGSATFNGGVWTFIATITYPATARLLQDVDSTITISGVAPATTVSDNLFSFTLNFVDAVTNGSPAVPSVTLQGIAGSTAEYNLMVIPDSGFRMPETNVTATESSAFVTIGNDDNRGSQTRVPISVTFQNTNTTASINVQGTGVSSGAGVSTYSLSVNATGSNFTIPDWTSANVLEGVGSIPLTIDIQANSGYSIDSISGVNAPTGVTVGSLTLLGDGALLPISVNPASASSGTLAFNVATSAEPYLLTVSLSEEFPQAKLSTTSLTTRFGPSDFGNTINLGTVVLIPTEGLHAFTSTNQIILPSVSGLSFGTPSLANGRISFTVGAIIPNSEGDVSYSATIGASLPPEEPANRTEQSPRSVTLSANAQSFGVNVTANGTWELDDADSNEFFTIRNVSNEGARGGAITVDVPANTTGSSRTATRRVTDGGFNIIGGITVTQTTVSDITSNQIGNIVISSVVPPLGTNENVITIVM